MSLTRLVAASVLCAAFVTGALDAQPAAGAADRPSAVPANPDTAAILHVLNRIGYGPRPGDVERVRAMGLASYIDQQLRPDRLADAGMSARLAGLDTLDMSAREIAERFFIPAAMERRERQRQRAADGEPMAGSNPDAPDQRADPSTLRQAQGRPEPGRGTTSSGSPRAGSRGERERGVAGAGGGAPAQEKETMDSPDMRERGQAMLREREALAELGEQRMLRAVYSERQLNEVLVDFWFNHFNVFAGKGADRIYMMEYERDVIRTRVLGKFRDLLGAVAESPAMLFYLDNWMSADPKMAEKASAARGRRTMPRRRGLEAIAQRRPTGLNENYARELLELHTLGVDGGYTQKDVVEVARAFTGWTIQNPRRGGSFRFEPRMHDDGEKIVLGQRIAPGGGKKDGERVLDIVAAHPSTARFIATKLARRFVADDPPAALVDRAAARFRDTDGDLRETLRAILTSPEFFAPAARRAKVKTPLEFVASAVRATGAEVDTSLPLLRSLRDLGMPLYMCQPPTGYGDTAEDWVNTGALLNRMNFAVALADGTMRGIRVNPDSLAARNAKPAAIADSLLGGQMSEATAATLAKTDDPAKLLALALGSPEFQRR
jgi:uncharacterized protein (DUF1800 family)